MHRLLATAILFCAIAALADPPARPSLREWIATGEKIMALTSSLRLQTEHDLSVEHGYVRTVREGVVKMQAREGTMSAEDLKAAKAYEAKAAAWTAKEDALLAAEETARADLIVPLCDAVNGLAAVRADMAREKANSSGVVDLQVLHTDGEMIQGYEADIKRLSPLYVAFRHHGFNGCESEGACVAANNKRNASE